MLTIAETVEFSVLWPDYWSAEEFGDFCGWLSMNPDAGVVIPHSDGCRKVRWSMAGTGKSGGVRVIYFNRLDERKIWLITIYAKKERASISAHILAKSREKVDGKNERKGTAGARRKARHRRRD